MSTNIHIEKLHIIKEMANEASVKQVCDVLIDYIKSAEKQEIGFVSKDGPVL